VVAESPHRLGLAPHAHEVEALTLDERDRDLAAEARVAREVDALLRALAEEALELVAAAGQGLRLGLRARRRGAGRAPRGVERAPAFVAEALAARVLGPAARQQTVVASGSAQAPQNLAVSRFSWPQLEQCNDVSAGSLARRVLRAESTHPREPR
jgi:hypothetical protein